MPATSRYRCMCTNVHIDLSRNYPKLGTKPSSTGWDALGASHHQPPWDHRSKTHGSPFKARCMCSTCHSQKLKNCGWDIAKNPINQLFWMAKAQSKIIGCLPSINWFILRISLENADPLVISYSLRHRKWPSRNTCFTHEKWWIFPSLFECLPEGIVVNSGYIIVA
jgi:hypothetical protein